MNDENKELTKTITSAIKETVPTAVKNMGIEKDVDDLKQEVKSMKTKAMLSKDGGEDEDVKKFAKSFIAEKAKASYNNEKVSSKALTKKIVGRLEKAGSNFQTNITDHGEEVAYAQFEKDILQRLDTFSIMEDVDLRNLEGTNSRILTKFTGDNMEVLYRREGENSDQGDGTLERVTINVASLDRHVIVTEELLADDATNDLYNEIIRKFTNGMRRKIENEVMVGTGDADGNGVLGILDFDAADADKPGIVKLADGSGATDITYDEIVDLLGKVKAKYEDGNEKIYTSKYVLTQLRKLRTADGYRLFPGLAEPETNIMGVPVRESVVDTFPQSSDDEDVDQPLMVYGNFDLYRLYRRKGTEIKRGRVNDQFIAGEETIRVSGRYGGAPEYKAGFAAIMSGNEVT